MSARGDLLSRAVEVRPEERAALLWSTAYFFSLLCGYYVLRPVREEMGIRSGLEKLPWAFTATFAVMLLAVPVFSWLVARVPRARAIPVVYRFFLLHLLLFFAAFEAGVAREALARAFFVWVSVYNLFVVSVFWSYMADLWRSPQARRLFGFISAGGSAGALLGPLLAATLARPLGVPALLLVSAAFLEVAARCAGRLSRLPAAGGGSGEANAAPSTAPSAPPAGPATITTASAAAAIAAGAGAGDGATASAPGDGAALGGGPFAGFAEVARSPYLLALAAQMLLGTVSGTLVYFQQARLVAELVRDPARRTALFAAVDLAVNLLALLLQSLATGRLLAAFGLGLALALHPLLATGGLLAVAAWPTLALVTAVQALRRAVHYAVERPAREVLFTVVPREAKYKAKSFIDTVVYRGGDALGAWGQAALAGLGAGLGGAALAATPLALAWLGVARYLRRRHAALESTRSP